MSKSLHRSACWNCDEGGQVDNQKLKPSLQNCQSFLFARISENLATHLPLEKLNELAKFEQLHEHRKIKHTSNIIAHSIKAQRILVILSATLVNLAAFFFQWKGWMCRKVHGRLYFKHEGYDRVKVHLIPGYTLHFKALFYLSTAS